MFQTHPNVDKKMFAQTSVIGPKNPEKPFPVGQEIGVLKWRFQTQDEAMIPLSSKLLGFLFFCCFFFLINEWLNLKTPLELIHHAI